MKLMIRLLLGIGLGLIVGHFAPEHMPVAMTFLAGFQNYFGQLIRFMIPLIILFMITHGVGSLRGGAGAMLGTTVSMAYASTVVAGLLAFFVARALLPHLLPEVIGPIQAVSEHGASATAVLTPLLDVSTALVLALLLGWAISTQQARSWQQWFAEGSQLIGLILAKVLIPLMPLYIGAVFAELAAAGQAFKTLQDFASVLLLAIGLHLVWLGVLYTTAGWVSQRSPWSLVRSMLPAYTTAVGTMSSAATIPITLRSVKAMGVSDSSANFTVPLCANIHLSGSMITIMTCATAVMVLAGDLQVSEPATMVPFICVLGLMMVAAPGAPGGAVMAALGVLKSMLGFSDAHLAMMIALYLAQDSFGTACNVTGDGFIALMVDKIARKRAVKPDEPVASVQGLG